MLNCVFLNHSSELFQKGIISINLFYFEKKNKALINFNEKIRF